MLEIYNTISRKKEVFETINNDKNVNLFVCGPTVYDDAHIGHGRTYISFDMIKRYLEFIGYSVFYVENITDIDDKIINRAKEREIDPEDLARDFEEKFKEDMEKLNVNSVNLYPRATYHLNEIFNQIEILISKGYAYETETGVYFETSKFKDFGKLSNRKLDKLDSHRIAIDKTKKDPKDFALWKKTEVDETPFYKSKWGNGRPGWHIEDTAITEKYFGPQYDIHGGGLDLIFPHHDAEIAQMEAISGKKPMVNYWMHTGFLNVDGVKMSKSLGNFITIRDLLKEWNPMAYRLFVLSTHYRSPIDFSSKSLNQALKNLHRLNKTVDNLKQTLDYLKNLEVLETSEKSNITDDPNKYKLLNQLNSAKEEFFFHMNDDFNTPRALAIILSFTKVINGHINEIDDKNNSDVSIEDLKFIRESLSLLKDFEAIFKLNIFTIKEEKKEDKSSQLLDIISFTREKLREEKNYDLSDEIRNKLNEIDINIED
ncbi:cysteine--tRNA ligase [Methanobrevibacter sp. TMH8]|uniref:cysteine--tRNA ligase n=1 Tax=Methanobrevibacter sp. TMH8 TaxID=2848611 RepID=UPI001CCB182E|nr:cysteine--tRNA ligase [Methanobrevibacter sp. TMH8]MBZ9570212.1 cysteine--tRNA ligase [Methanobrevibacter sp. TMH8]